MKSIGEALREIVSHFEPTGVVRLPLLDALGHVLSQDVVARQELPAFDNSAMDGYAVRCGDVAAEGASLAVAGEARAGASTGATLPAGRALRIFTGAPLPAGADAVVIQEHTRREGERVVIERLPHAGQHIRLRGSDLARDAVALARGERLGPGEVGLLAAQGLWAVSVHRRPRVAIVTTGDELRDAGDPPRPGTLVNSNAYALAAQVKQAGAEPWMLPSARDHLPDLVARLRDGLQADVLLSVGGVSVGDYDLVGQAMESLGIERGFWKVAIKPGKPLLFGRAGRVPVIGLPGNPVSAMVTFEVFVRPGLRRMQGHPAPYPAVRTVELAQHYRHGTGRTELLRARLEASGERPRALLHPLQGSGSVPSMCGVDGLVVLDGEVEEFSEGTLVPALVLREFGQSEAPWI